jgi:hypothetical protein
MYNVLEIKSRYRRQENQMIREQFDSKSEAKEAAQNICAQFNVKTFVYWFPRAIPRRGAVVDAEGAAQYQGQAWAELIFTCSADGGQ